MLVLLSIPQLRRRDVTPGCLASLDAVAARGGITDLVPPFPGLAASSFATLVTGAGPSEHGLIGNAYFDRRARAVVPGPLPDSALEAPRLWDRLRERKPGARTLVWFGPNTEGARVDVRAGVGPGGSLATTPAALAGDLAARLGPFPCPDLPRGKPPSPECTAWMLRAASLAIAAEAPDLAIVRVPYLGQVARRFGPDGREAGRAVGAMEAALAPFLGSLPREAVILAATESVSTPVAGPIYPNRVLRALGLLALRPCPGGGQDVDLEGSAAFALADHQIAHIYLNDPGQAANVASAFAGLHDEGVATVAPGSRRADLGLAHPRSGDVVLVAEPDRWFAPDWWNSAAEAPRGEVPSRLAPPDPLPPSPVLGSLGSPPPNASYLGVVISSRPGLLGDAPQHSSGALAGMILDALAPSPASSPASRGDV